MQHPDRLRLQAYFDGEVDAVAAADIENHAEQCGQCRSALDDLKGTRSALREHLTDYRAPEALRLRLVRALDEESGASQTSPASPRSIFTDCFMPS